jgi:hypothetical protein
MDKNHDLASINRLSVLTGRDRRTLERALANLRPDAHEGRGPLWRLGPALRSLLSYEATRARTGGVGTPPGWRIAVNEPLQAAVAEIERAAAAAEALLVQLRQERNVAHRRAVLAEHGAVIGRFERAHNAALDALPDGDRLIAEIVGDKIIGAFIGEIVDLCGFDPPTQREGS